jgi:hypothetical protein
MKVLIHPKKKKERKREEKGHNSTRLLLMYLVSKDYKTRKGAMSNIPIFIKRVNNPYYMKFSSIENARLGKKKRGWKGA